MVGAFAGVWSRKGKLTAPRGFWVEAVKNQGAASSPHSLCCGDHRAMCPMGMRIPHPYKIVTMN